MMDMAMAKSMYDRGNASDSMHANDGAAWNNRGVKCINACVREPKSSYNM